MLELLRTFSWQELRHHPWRHGAAVVAVMLGVALAFAVHLINASALDEFAQAARSAGGEPDLSLSDARGPFDESVYAQVAAHPDVALASPVLDLHTQALGAGRPGPDGPERVRLRVLGLDALAIGRIAPDLLPQLDPQADRLDLFAPDAVFLNPAAQTRLGRGTPQLQSGQTLRPVRVLGTVASGGAPLAVMDIGAAQQFFGRQGQLDRIDLRLRPGVDPSGVLQALRAQPGWPPGLRAAEPADAAQRLGAVSRAYRVNLTVLALIALFTGAFLVFSVLALSVAKRAQPLALLGVLGLTARQRMQLVLWESLALGLLGSLLGLALGTGLAALALRLLGGDLGGGYFAGVQPALQWHPGAALLVGAAGVLAALVGGWWPAHEAARLPPAQTLKGLDSAGASSGPAWLAPALMLLALALAHAPPLGGLPVAAYLSVALLLVGGIFALPGCAAWALRGLHPLTRRHALPMLALERARRARAGAAVALSGVVASLSLAVALTVMVASFRDSVTQWLDRVLPADLYVRSAASLREADSLYFSPELVQAAERLPGVQRLRAQRLRALQLDPARAPVALLVGDWDEASRHWPMTGPTAPLPAGRVGIYVSEAVVDLYGARWGTDWPLLSEHFRAPGLVNKGSDAIFFVAGVWRDYARQGGAIALHRQDYSRLSDDRRSNDLAFWLAPGVEVAQIQQGLRAEVERESPGAGALLEFGTTSQIRAASLTLFDRSFAVTYWLQAVAIGIGLFGVAASFSAQVLARRKEFGLLAHLGLTRRQILTLVTAEGAVWTGLGALAGTALGLAVAVVLVHVVNPQSFHWTMDMSLPAARITLLALAVVLAGTLTAWLTARPAAGRGAVLAVKEDW